MSELADIKLNNRYQLKRVLGEGGFGTVYLADDEQKAIEVVIKIAHTADEALARRIREEAEGLMNLNHPNIVDFLEIGRTDDGRQFLVMRDINGISLAEILDQSGRLPIADALAVTKAIGSALALVHEKGILHRDIKPSNILIPDAAGALAFEKAMLTDFGALGRLTEEAAGGATTVAGQFFGTPYYMAPEQIRAAAQTPAADIYGVGVLLFKMIFGQTPFQDSESVIAFIRRATKEEIEFPMLPILPEGLQKLIRDCLHKHPEARPANGSELLSRLEQVQIEGSKAGATPALSPDPQPPRTNEEAEHPSPEDKFLATTGMREIGPGRPASSSRKSSSLSWIAFIGAGIIAVTAAFYFWQPVGGATTWRMGGILGGILLIFGGIGIGLLIHQILGNSKTQIEKDAEDLLLGAQSRAALSKSLAIEVEDLIARCESIDQRILGITIVQMVGEFQAADSSSDRQAALMNVAQLLEKLIEKLSPWYIRKEKTIAFVVTVIGIVSGILTIVATVLGMFA